MEVRFFDNKVEDFINGLEDLVNAKVLRAIALLEEFGPGLRMPQSKQISRRLFELRVGGKLSVRVMYTFHQDVAVLLHAFIKKSDKIPLREIWLAKAKLLAIDIK